MVEEEADQRGGGIAADLFQRSRPDRSRHRQQVIVAEGVAVAVGTEVVLQRHAVGLEPRQVLRRLAIEAGDVGQHAQEPRRQQVALLGEDAAQAEAGIFERPVVQRDRQRHVGLDVRHAEVGQQGREVRVVGLVVDDEAGVDRDGAVEARRLGGVGVATKPRIGLEQGHVVPPGQEPGRGESGDARADDGHFQPTVLFHADQSLLAVRIGASPRRHC